MNKKESYNTQDLIDYFAEYPDLQFRYYYNMMLRDHDLGDRESLESILMSGFNWSNTFEGHYFWSRINNAIIDSKNEDGSYKKFKYNEEWEQLKDEKRI